VVADRPIADPPPRTGAHAAVSDEAPLTDALYRAVAGDDSGFALLYGHLHPRLRRYAMSLVGQEADDVVAEAWLQIARDLRAFRGDLDSFRGWTARVVRNRAMDHLRHAARRPADPMPELPERPSTDDTAASAMERMGTDRAVALIAALPREQAEAVMLRAVVGLDAKQAGLVLGKSPEAVRTSAHRGLKRLAAGLADER
jgi:RNA polymerase sigma-70 factor (ECF subfamily)